MALTQEAYLEDLLDAVGQGGTQDPDGSLFSGCLSTWACALRTLGAAGWVTITRDHGRSVTATVVPYDQRPPLPQSPFLDALQAEVRELRAQLGACIGGDGGR